MKVLLAPTESFIKSEHGQLTADASAGSSVALSVVNSDGFAANNFVVVGVEGSDGAELCQVTGTTATTITVATLKLAHRTNEPVTKYRYDKRKFYGAIGVAVQQLQGLLDTPTQDLKEAEAQITLLETVATQKTDTTAETNSLK